MGFVTLEQAKSLNDLGFDLVCEYWYELFGKNKMFCPITPDNYNNRKVFEDNVVSAPTLSQAIKWIRDNKDYIGFVTYSKRDGFSWEIDKSDFVGNYHKTWENAERNLLDELILLISKNKLS
jgi:hypothetical protein